MKKRIKGKKLGRSTSQRKALFKSLIQSLIMHEEIKTTESKAKAIRRLFDKLVTKSKAGSLHVRRQILAFLPDRKAANKLFDEIAPRFKKRAGGFTRFIRIGKRRGDNAMLVKMELTEKKEKEKEKETEKKKGKGKEDKTSKATQQDKSKKETSK